MSDHTMLYLVIQILGGDKKLSLGSIKYVPKYFNRYKISFYGLKIFSAAFPKKVGKLSGKLYAYDQDSPF